MKTILIPTDFSQTARNAFIYAVNLFGIDKKYVLLNTYEEPYSTSASMISLQEILHESSLEGLNEELQALKREFKNEKLNIQLVSEYGSTVEGVEYTAKTHKADIIVMGTTGASGVKGVMIGSVASAVIQNAPCAVIVVPGSYSYKAPKKILFASDLKSGVHQNDADLLEKIAGKNKGSITFLTVAKGESEIPMSEAEHGYDLHVRFQELEHGFEVISSDNVERAIADFALANEMDMVVTIPRKASWFSRILNPSVSKKLAQHITIPVLALTN